MMQPHNAGRYPSDHNGWFNRTPEQLRSMGTKRLLGIFKLARTAYSLSYYERYTRGELSKDDYLIDKSYYDMIKCELNTREHII